VVYPVATWSGSREGGRHSCFYTRERERPTGFEPVTFGFVDARCLRVVSSGVGLPAAKSRFEPEPPWSSRVESCDLGYHSVPRAVENSIRPR
jgi:hypothetical protein